ncbi:hypothetical protein E2C01_042481 [Portunus trituberculatus]|uniref:Uncharacterized protein n=1 Tax=Portunus trituberculatus TaxID=210409 RepID=A0A5B7FTT0_PORTR|nr:hypothetical protein [Portunus trituberculatus]
MGGSSGTRGRISGRPHVETDPSEIRDETPLWRDETSKDETGRDEVKLGNARLGKVR